VISSPTKGTMPLAPMISSRNFKTPYMKSTPKLKEIQMHVKELLRKGYTRLSLSPWGALVLFKKKGTLRLCIYFR